MCLYIHGVDKYGYTQGAFQEHERQAQRVDKLLVFETSKHFNAQADVNMKKLTSLFRKQLLEKDHFIETVGKQVPLTDVILLFVYICEQCFIPPSFCVVQSYLCQCSSRNA